MTDSMTRRAFRLLTAEDVLALPPPSWLVGGLVPAGCLSVVYGTAGTFKSFLALDWACSVASGQAWLSRRVERGWVLYIAAEGVVGLGARLRSWMSANPDADLSRLRVLPEAANLLTDSEVKLVRRALDGLPEPPGLIVVDTAARTMVGGDENAAKDVGKFIASVDELRGGGAALVVHHSGKGTGAQERGSSALRGAADLMARIERPDGDLRVTLSCDKLKDAAEWPDMRLAMMPTAESLVVTLDVDAEEACGELDEQVLTAVVDEPGQSGSAIAKRLKKRKEAVLRALTALESAGRVIRTEKGYNPVPDGAEPPRNRPSVATVGDGSQEGDTPVGGPLRGPPDAQQIPGSPDLLISELGSEDAVFDYLRDELDGVELIAEHRA